LTPIRLSLACLFCSAFAVALPASASASAKPGLKVTKLASASKVARGAPLSAKATVRASKKVAKPSAVSFWLSSKRTKGKGDKRVVGGEFVPALGAGKTSSRAAVAFVPKSVKPGSYYLLACADNCLASKRKLKVVKPRAAAKVTPHLADANAVSQLVSAAAGGTLTSTGPDGSTYKLEIPAGALSSDTTIKMTPVASITGLPFTAAVAGVDLQPEGLALLKPARLTITPAHAPPAGRQVTVGWHAGGQDLHLEPTSNENGFVFGLEHFSGDELVNGTPKQVAAQLQRPPVSSREQLSQAIYQATKGGHAAEDLPPMFESYYDTTIKGLLDRAKTDDSVVSLALTEALGWVRDVELLGLGSDPGLKARSNEVTSQLVTIVKNAANRSSDKCIAGDLGQIGRMLAIERFAQVLGFTTGDVFDKIHRCLHFELDFNGAFQVREVGANGPDDIKTDFTTKIAGLKIAGRLTPDESQPGGSQSLAYPTYTATANNGCHADSLSSITEQRPFSVASLDVSAKLTMTVDAQGRTSFSTGPPQVALALDPGQRTENFTYSCNQGSEDRHVRFFDIAFKQDHSSEFVSSSGIYTLTGWTPGSGGVLATKTYQVPLAGTISGRYGETSTFTLRHTPEK
jgi:hypothetical protein